MKRTASRSNKELRLVFVRVCLIVAILPMVVPMPVQTADGDLDLTFGDGGTLLLPDISGIDAVAVQPDGKIIGVTIFVRPDITADFVLVRLESDGTLDSNFGSGGQVITDIFGGHGSPTDLVLQDDGKIVVLGTTEYRTPGPTSDFTIARYNSDGSLDASFGTGGIIHTGFSGNINFASSVLINPDGKILVVGTTGNSTNAPTFDFALARYNHDGSLDITFGNGGKLTLDFYNSYEVATSAAIQLDGKIVIAGSINNPEPSIALARFSKDGDLDISFGDAGKVTIDI